MIKVAATLLVQSGEYVLQHRDDIPTISDPGMISLWGGRLEGNETGEQGALRELREETGISAALADLIPLHHYHTVGTSPQSSGEAIEVSLFAVEIGPATEVMVYEGQGMVRIPKYGLLDDRVHSLAKEAIELYEAKT